MESSKEPLAKQPLTVVQRHYQAVQHGDAAGITAEFAPEVQWIEMAGSPLGGVYVGADQIFQGVFRRINQTFTEFACIPERFITEGDRVVMVGNYHAKNSQNASERIARVVHLWTVQNGLITRFEQVTDAAALFDAEGSS